MNCELIIMLRANLTNFSLTILTKGMHYFSRRGLRHRLLSQKYDSVNAKCVQSMPTFFAFLINLIFI